MYHTNTMSSPPPRYLPLFLGSSTKCYRHPCVNEWFPRRLRRVLTGLLLTFIIFFVILWIGMEIEQSYVRAGEGTHALYETTNVCGLEYPPYLLELQDNFTMKEEQEYTTAAALATTENILAFQTFPNASAARQHNDHTLIAHCGDCGECSNPHDINIYDETSVTLFKATLDCAKHGVFGGRRLASACMTDRVGMTPGCTDCWVENIMCDLRNCIYTCFFHAIVSGGIHEGQQQELNRCTLCDEVRCGPKFIECVGANRRRSGIMSDIERDDQEVCTAADDSWWKDVAIQELWKEHHISN
jgi:hypothetical protein